MSIESAVAAAGEDELALSPDSPKTALTFRQNSEQIGDLGLTQQPTLPESESATHSQPQSEPGTINLSQPQSELAHAQSATNNLSQPQNR